MGLERPIEARGATGGQNHRRWLGNGSPAGFGRFLRVAAAPPQSGLSWRAVLEYGTCAHLRCDASQYFWTAVAILVALSSKGCGP